MFITKNQKSAPAKPDNKKVISVVLLFIFAAAITLAGASFAVFSVLNGVTLKVLNSQIPGAVFGAVIAFLGVRYILSVRTLKNEIFNSESSFSTGNFKKNSASKALAKAK